jgi:hypothetical protein
MGRFEYHIKQPDNSDAATLARRLAEIEKRQAAFEQRLAFLERRPVANADQARTPYGWGDQVGGDPYYHKPDLAGTMERVGMWTSTTQRIVADLTSSQTARRTLQEACLAGIFFTCAGGFAAGLGHLPWLLAPVVGAAGGSLSLGVLVVHNRSLLDRLVTSQVNRGIKRQQETRVQIDKFDTGGHKSVDFLHLGSDVTEAQLAEFARAVLGGASLAVHKWTGQGALFTRSQFDDLMSELVKMNYVRDAAGNVARSLTSQGKALMRALAEKG